MFDALRTRPSARPLIPAVVALVCGSVVSLPAAAAAAADDSPVLPVAPAVGQNASPGAAGAHTPTDPFILKFKAPATAASGLRTESSGKVARNLASP
ncbi:hypothetical protein PV761_11985 [Arthrobacter sp. CC3]|uniref:hypothetical protein n=1 Tax=Arthrobacter sp. CC3 TaxID=3029185 RepID=UPI003267D7BF